MDSSGRERVELCCYKLPRLESLPEGSDVESLVDRLLELYYSSWTMDDSILEDSFETRITPEIRERRIVTRREQLMSLLRGHPHPFDKAATIRRLSQDVAAYVSWLRSTKGRRCWKLYAAWRRHMSQVGHRSERRVQRIWPTLLTAPACRSTTLAMMSKQQLSDGC